MVVTGYSYICLLCLDRFNGERSFSAIYHLLRGKKTSQTLQDMQLFGLSGLFSLFPQIKRETIEEACRDLEANKLIGENGNLTSLGKVALDHSLAEMPIPKELNSWKHGRGGREAWTRLSLLIQTATHLIHNKSRFLPVTSDEEAQQWVKSFLAESNLDRIDLAFRLYEELDLFLTPKQDFMAELFVFRLTTPKRAGLTYVQLEEKLGKDPVYLELCFWSLMHDLLENAVTSNAVLLSKLIVKGPESLPLTQSAKRTLMLLKQGKSKGDACKIRNLKMSTIEDHIVEIAMHDRSFDLNPYLLPDEKDEIAQAIGRLKTKQLKNIKENLDNKYTYFQIRLGMAVTKR
ncbi:helix-turn-helix domain-containing protein [Metabacillus sp. KIGAM252]|uniref:Helix-turn-helix domain-containing protein n=1 Tax=Metabacillus flavus TaxID=2823519 RepID=A0ABS5LFD1_9BACI|nr:helix-turn-helix domain-containing protein [Metabacillus flavus]MBS2969447.1 helix-turn-helix domain-containing protein [Metabacillus flavus]